MKIKKVCLWLLLIVLLASSTLAFGKVVIGNPYQDGISTERMGDDDPGGDLSLEKNARGNCPNPGGTC